MQEKNELFAINLEKEKEKFEKDIQDYKASFVHLKTFNSLNQANEFSNIAYSLKE